MVIVGYYGGESRNGNHPVDYMIVEINGIELYSELPTSPDNYNLLKKDIQKQARHYGISTKQLHFWFD